MRKTPVDSTELQGLVLASLIRAGGRAHGLAVKELVNEGRNQPIPAGSFYRVLHRLETDGVVDAEWETEEEFEARRGEQGPRRRYYRLSGVPLAVEATHPVPDPWPRMLPQ